LEGLCAHSCLGKTMEVIKGFDNGSMISMLTYYSRKGLLESFVLFCDAVKVLVIVNDITYCVEICVFVTTWSSVIAEACGSMSMKNGERW